MTHDAPEAAVHNSCGNIESIALSSLS